MLIRSEKGRDEAAIRAVNVAAFDTDAEAALVEALRKDAHPIISLVADDGGMVVGHILFSPVSLPLAPDLGVMGLAPMAVVPARQGSGVGSALVCAGLERCRESGFGAVVVLGHPGFYPRFGFVAAARFGLRCEYEVPEESFMAMELAPGVLVGASGVVKYHPAFRAVSRGGHDGAR